MQEVNDARAHGQQGEPSVRAVKLLLRKLLSCLQCPPDYVLAHVAHRRVLLPGERAHEPCAEMRVLAAYELHGTEWP